MAMSRKVKKYIDQLSDNTLFQEEYDGYTQDTSTKPRTFLFIKSMDHDNIPRQKPELKKICKKYNISETGNKKQLFYRIAARQYLDICSTQIIKIIKGWIVRHCLHLRGPGLENRAACINQTDFFSLEDIQTIPYEQFYSFRDSRNNVYGGDIRSFYNLKMGDYETLNPYNRDRIYSYQFAEMKRIATIHNIFFQTHTNLYMRDDCDKNYVINKTIEIFMRFRKLVDPKWKPIYGQPSIFYNSPIERCLLLISQMKHNWREFCAREDIPYSKSIFRKNVNINYIVDQQNKWNIKRCVLELFEDMICPCDENMMHKGGRYICMHINKILCNRDS